MKKILAVIGVAALLATVNLQATPALNSPNSLGGNLVSNGIPVIETGGNEFVITNAPYIDVSKSQSPFSFGTTISGSAVLGWTNVYRLWPTYDGVHFDTNNADSLLASNVVLAGSAAGGYTNIQVQSLSAGPYAGFVVGTIHTTATGTITNSNTPFSIGYGQKIDAP